jgi:integrase
LDGIGGLKPSGGPNPEGKTVILRSYEFHLRAKNQSPTTIKSTLEYLAPFLAVYDPRTASKRDIEAWLGDLAQRCKPSTVWTSWRHLRGLFNWLLEEEEILSNPMGKVAKPIVPPSEVKVLDSAEIKRLLEACRAKDRESRRDLAIISIMLDTGIRLAELASLHLEDVSSDGTLRIFGKGRKWRSVALGVKSQQALSAWIRASRITSGPLWVGRRGPITPTGIRKALQRRAGSVGIHLHPHMLRHTFVDNWIRNGGSEVDLARLAGWTTTRMAERYARHRADERALEAHKSVAPPDRL